MVQIHLTKKDFRIDWFSGTGGGGQHRNKHKNCCRITHLKTGLTTQSTKHRERPPNQKAAFKHLASMILAWYSDDNAPLRRHFGEARIRTYHEPRNEVLDHASGLRMQYKDVVLNLDIGPMVEARKQAAEAQ